MVKPVNDNGNEVLRKTAKENQFLNKYELIISDTGITKGLAYDNIQITYQTLTDTFTYRIATEVQGTVVITYAASNKKDIVSIART